MRIGIAALILAYVLSQFYRAFLAVMAPVLKADLGVSAADLASASGWWFLAFAAMQVPIGSLLDRIGPRLTTGALMAVGAVGALVFAKAAGALQLKLAMALIGIGCAPVLMASYFIFARQFSPAVFGTLAGLTIGIGSLGNVASALPLSAAVADFGWRETMLGLAAITGAVALVILVLVRDPPRLATARDGSLLDLLRIPAIRLLFASQALHCARACGCASTARMPSSDGSRRSRLWRTSRLVSPTTCRGDWRKRSSDREITPSVEFSTGTTPNSAVPAAVARNTSSMLIQGTRSMLVPKNCRAACSLKVPTGPRKATRCGASRARQADMISRQMCATLSPLSGPPLAV